MSSWVWILIFTFSVAAIAWTYVGYGVFLWVWQRLGSRRRAALPEERPSSFGAGGVEAHAYPRISIVIPAYNEEAYIREKLENCLMLDWPEERREILVVSDGSDDRTVEIAREYESRGMRVLEQTQRSGKSAALNRGAAEGRGELLLFSDTSSLLSIDALRLLTRHFENPAVGAVSGTYRAIEDLSDPRALSEGAYWRFETGIRHWEALVSSTLGAHGTCLMLRRECYQPLEADLINDDFVLPMRVLEAGWRVEYEPRAASIELAATSTQGEVRRRVRIMAGNWQQLGRLRSLLHPRRGLIAFQLVSHKGLRILSPFLFLTALVSNAILAAQGPWPWFVPLAGQVVFHGLALAVLLRPELGRRFTVFHLVLYIDMLNYTALRGAWRYVRGAQASRWERVDNPTG